MRKILVLGLLGLFFSSISTLLLAGYPECDAMKADLQDDGIYGWCNAWYDGADQEQIKQKLLDRTGSDVPPWLAGCPCWGTSELEAAVNTSSCQDLGKAIGAFAAYESGQVNFVAGSGDGGNCLYANVTVDPIIWRDLSGIGPDQYESCYDSIAELIIEDFSGSCP